ncbi:filamentous hemagglutinin N-terminal domain-containing protein [Campylobacter jejuni]|nr:filamentous hemagglutinin N-terminal domain-containing protein [Campylobacter jejuni]
MKKLNKLSLSLVAGSLLFTQSYALPSGGKFTHGTSGTININDKVMNITGNKQNSVIQWGGGFNIASGETVNFKGTNQNYLNIVYGSKSSHIDGKLEGGSNNIFLINPNGIVVGKGGSINANRVYLSTSSVSNEDMQRFANGVSDTDVIFGTGKNISPVIQLNPKGNIINLGTIEGKNDLTLIGNEIAQFDKDKNVGSYKSNNHISTRARIFYLLSTSNINNIPGIAEGSLTNGGMSAASVDQFVSQGKIVSETSNLITSADIDSNIINSIFNDLKFNSNVNINDLSKIYGEDGKLLSEDILQSVDFITALYEQTNTSDTLKNALANSQDFLNNAGKIADIQAKLKNISDLKTQQASNKAEYDKAVKEYEDAVKAYNTALKGLTGNNADTTLAGLKQAVDNAYKKVQDSISKNEGYYTQLEGLKTEVSGISIDGEHKLTVSGSFDRNYAILPSVNSGSNNSNNGNDGTDSGDINNGNNNGSNNNPNDTIGQQEPDIATALLMQTTDEDPNINEDDKQASIDEANTQESGNACIVSDNFKVGNPCSR